MFRMIAVLFHTLPLVLAWLYLGVALWADVAHIVRVAHRETLSWGRWVFVVFNSVYILVFGTTRIFCPDVWETLFSVLGLLAMVVVLCRSRYVDKQDGKRWWNW